MEIGPNIVMTVITKNRPGSLMKAINSLHAVTGSASTLIVIDSSSMQNAIGLNRKIIENIKFDNKYHLPINGVTDKSKVLALFSHLRIDHTLINKSIWNTPQVRELAFAMAASTSNKGSYLFIDDDVQLKGKFKLPENVQSILPFEISGTPDFCRLGWLKLWISIALRQQTSLISPQLQDVIQTKTDLPIQKTIRQRLSYGSGMAFITNINPRNFIPLPDCYGEDTYLLSKFVIKDTWVTAGEITHTPPLKTILLSKIIMNELVGQASVNVLSIMNVSRVSFDHIVRQAWLLGISDIDKLLWQVRNLSINSNVQNKTIRKIYETLTFVRHHFLLYGGEVIIRIIKSFHKKSESQKKIHPKNISKITNDFRIK